MLGFRPCFIEVSGRVPRTSPPPNMQQIFGVWGFPRWLLPASARTAHGCATQGKNVHDDSVTPVARLILSEHLPKACFCSFAIRAQRSDDGPRNSRASRHNANVAFGHGCNQYAPSGSAIKGNISAVAHPTRAGDAPQSAQSTPPAAWSIVPGSDAYPPSAAVGQHISYFCEALVTLL